MVIYAKFINKNWKVDEDTCTYFPIFRAILERRGAKHIAYIALLKDPSSPFAYILDEKEREKEVYESVFGKEIVDFNGIEEAKKKYASMCDTQENKLRDSYMKSATKIEKYMDSIKKVDAENLKDVLAVMKELPNVIDTVSNLKKSSELDNKQNVGKVKANRELSRAELKFRE